jgi:arylformamidase
MDYYDISPEITEDIAVFPGDTPFSRVINRDIEQGDGYSLSHIKTTVHLGAHTDAPNHYVKGGQDIASRDLSFYYGKAQVIAVIKNQTKYRITLNDIKDYEIGAERVLFRTDSFLEPNCWTENFTAIEPQVIEYLASKNVRLLGIDTPSVDTADDAKLVTHHMVAKYDMAILEGIVLSDVEEGFYQLCALPLKIRGADASPVRAILIKE